jgi:hypothetical protein
MRSNANKNLLLLALPDLVFLHRGKRVVERSHGGNLARADGTRPIVDHVCNHAAMHPDRMRYRTKRDAPRWYVPIGDGLQERKVRRTQLRTSHGHPQRPAHS